MLLALPGTNIAWPGALSARTARRRDRASAPQAGEEMGGMSGSNEMVGNYGRNDEKKWENHGKSILMLHVWNIDLHFNLCGWIILGNQRINLPSNRQGHAGSMLIWGRVISVPYYLLLEIVQV